MAEDQTPEQDAVLAEQPQGPGLRIMAQFIRDVSFENPRAPESLRGGTMPKIDMQVELAARNRQDGLFEVDLKLIAAARRDEEVAFHAEVLYGGLFAIDGVPADQMEPFLLIECPRFLFPFARQVISSLTSEGGFPPFRIEPLDFAAIYMARIQQQQGGNGAEGGEVQNT